MAKLSKMKNVKPKISKKLKQKSKLKLPNPGFIKLKVLDSTKNNSETKAIAKIEEEKVEPSLSTEELAKRYPIFKDEVLIKKFTSVTLTNNQKGRIRQQLRNLLKSTSELLLPDVINNRIQAILKGSNNLTDPELRKIRILYNMLKTAINNDKPLSTTTKTTTQKTKKDKNRKDKKIKEKENQDIKETVVKENIGDVKTEKEEKPKKIKGPKRYVVFLGNLPLDIDKEQIMDHFSEFKDHIVGVRIPKQEGKKSSIAYVELKNESSYELALSKHHSMLANKRINVLYTTQKNGKITKAEAKGKSAKLIALQKSGKLTGSVPLNKKRSHRRMKAKQARAKQEE